MDVRGSVGAVLETLGFDSSELRDDARLQEDLGVDSTELVEVAVALENRLAIGIDAGRLVALDTVGELVGFIEEVERAAHPA